ncbi:MAG: peptide-methionine (R)-S-oxide reductase MsrB [Phenylobacterium sp.]|nr:peptide-methionine (R)-S-oxide reductase MsrB [Phenylobacterium sp.]
MDLIIRHPDRRRLLATGAGLILASATSPALAAKKDAYAGSAWRKVTDAEWRKRLPSAAYSVLRHEGTERAGTSPLNREKRKGVYHCLGCDLPLFNSVTKYDSGTGWPSFYRAMPGAFGTKIDHKIGVPRTEYHCAQCLGHHGHIFEDGPRPTGLRYCNNGVALKFVPA